MKKFKKYALKTSKMKSAKLFQTSWKETKFKMLQPKLCNF